MTRRSIVIICVMMVAVFLASCGGGVKVAEPKGMITDDETGKVFKDSVDFMEHMKTEKPEEYKTLYELSKTNRELTKEYIEEKTKILNENNETEYRSDESGHISEKEFFDILNTKYGIEINPVSVVEAYYSALSNREFGPAFELLHKKGTTFSKYQNPKTFESMNSEIASNMKITDLNIQSVNLNDLGEKPLVKIGCRLLGFFIKEKTQPNVNTENLSPSELIEMEKKAREGQADETVEWGYKETGIVWITLEGTNGNWLIYDIP
ncbi:MAG: hypothetical protein R2883_06615 [Caldisericia bacterium]